MAKLDGYRAIIAGGVHRTQWGVPNLLILTLTTSAKRVAEIVAKIGANGSPAFLFKAVDERSLLYPCPDLLTTPWQRAGHAPLCIGESS
jgi:hypothetical protein